MTIQVFISYKDQIQDLPPTIEGILQLQHYRTQNPLQPICQNLLIPTK